MRPSIISTAQTATRNVLRNVQLVSSAQKCSICSATRRNLATSTSRRKSITSFQDFKQNKLQIARESEDSSSSHLPVFEAHLAPRPQKTHEIADLSFEQLDQPVVIQGWLDVSRRANDDLSFHMIRSVTGEKIQISHVAGSRDWAFAPMDLPLESVVLVEGIVRKKVMKLKKNSPIPEERQQLEIAATNWIILNPARRSLPFLPGDESLPSETKRAQHRYLELRTKALGDNIRKRSEVARVIREHLYSQNFTEMETPILLQSSPEGAREFLVPTRVTLSSTPSGKPSPLFYALPQSPQQPKQLIISSGVTNKYFQIAKCFRDESGRADRQPEFTQVDLEMGFISGSPDAAVGEGVVGRWCKGQWRIGGEEVRRVIEGLVKDIWRRVEEVDLGFEGGFPVMSYHEAMSRFGSDKPDVRYKFEIKSASQFLSQEHKSQLEASGEMIEFLVHPSTHFAEGARSPYLSEKVERLVVKKSELSQSRMLSSEEVASLSHRMKEGEILWVSRRKSEPEGGNTTLGRIRLDLIASSLLSGHLKQSNSLAFLWVTEFPLFTLADEDKDFQAKGRWSSSHHPFTAPMYEDLGLLTSGEGVEKVRGQHYDLVLNGMEVGGGSVRIHDAVLQEWVMREVLQLKDDEIARFSHLLTALSFGAPPHGGIALGFDRLTAILCGASSIRDVIAFPKSSTTGSDPVFKSPSAAVEGTLKDYGLKEL